MSILRKIESALFAFFDLVCQDVPAKYRRGEDQ